MLSSTGEDAPLLTGSVDVGLVFNVAVGEMRGDAAGEAVGDAVGEAIGEAVGEAAGVAVGVFCATDASNWDSV